MSHKVESITENDIEDLHELFSTAGPYIRVRSLSDYWLYARLFNSTCLCIDSDTNTPLAALLAFRDQTPGRNEIYVQDIAVRPDRRGQDYGEALFSDLHQRARQWHVTRVWLTSEYENRPALRLWAKLNYKNPVADYLSEGVWISRNLKGSGSADSRCR